jgi:hypothetical protein
MVECSFLHLAALPSCADTPAQTALRFRAETQEGSRGGTPAPADANMFVSFRMVLIAIADSTLSVTARPSAPDACTNESSRVSKM